MKLARRKPSGFTMIEIMVVIGILALLMAIIVPVGKRLTENNKTSRCEAQLSHLGQALKLYYLDEQGVPPIGATATGVVDHDLFPGLGVLYSLDYLRNREALHCPRHLLADSGDNVTGDAITKDSPEYYRSYMLRDRAVKPGTEPLKQYKYMPYRYALQADYPDDYLRQLTRNVQSVDLGGTTYTVSGASSALPPDDTIVTWCNYHAESYRINRHGQYVVLYWDGSVRLMDQELFTDSTVAPAEAWLVKSTDIAH